MQIRCECGGTLKRGRLGQFDFSVCAGIDLILKNVPGLRCTRCRGTTLGGIVINGIMRDLPLVVIKQSERLSGSHARYLRRFLRLTEEELAGRMGIATETIADWEGQHNEISPQHDLMLRAIVVARLMGTAKTAPKRADVVAAISSARVASPDRGSRSSLVLGSFA